MESEELIINSLKDPNLAVACSWCNWKGRLRNCILSESGPHLRADCKNCGRFIMFAAKRKIRLAPEHQNVRASRTNDYDSSSRPRHDTLSKGLSRGSHVKGLRSYR